MYQINSKTDKPDIGYMEMKIDQLMTKGIRIGDCEKVANYYTQLRDALYNDFCEKYGVANPNSPKQIVAFIEELSRQVDITSKNDIINICFDDETGKWTSNAEAMEKLADLGYEFAQDLLDYRHVKKYAESIESIMGFMDENRCIHPRVSLGKTNRINYSEPGLMTIPKKLIWQLIAPYTPGNKLYSVDIKNQEPSILINLVGAKELKYALESPDGLYETLFKQCFQPTVTANVLIDTFLENRVFSADEVAALGVISPDKYTPTKPMTREVYYKGKRVVYIDTICLGSEKGLEPALPETVNIQLEDGEIVVLPVTWGDYSKKYKRANDYSVVGQLSGLDVQISKAERKEFKTAYLAISYGASKFGIKNMCKIIDGKRVYDYVTNIPAIKSYRDKIGKLANEGKNVIGTAFGSILNAGDNSDPKRLKRVLLDLPIQGTGADILSFLVKRFYDYTEDKQLTDKMSLYYTRHDELILEINKDWYNKIGAVEVEKVIRDMLEHRVNDWTPFLIEVNCIADIELEKDLSEE